MRVIYAKTQYVAFSEKAVVISSDILNLDEI